MQAAAGEKHMGACCSNEAPKFDGMSPSYRNALWVVIIINAIMFGVEMAAGALSGSQALKADALDFLADAITYSLSLWAIGRSVATRSYTAIFKGASLAVMGLWVLEATIYSVFVLETPQAHVMGVISVLALLANLLSVLVLMKYKDGDANVRSVWLCSRNDAIGNVAVMVAAIAVYLTTSAWPDLIVAAAMAGLFLWSSIQILAQAIRELREDRRLFGKRPT
jgi:Co/Zn/Cd efflux system component